MNELAEAIAGRKGEITAYIRENPPAGLTSGALLPGVMEYLRRPGKCLRGSVCMLSCGLFGGKEEEALPAAAAIEVFHVWTLVHDDIVDRDLERRGGPTLHRYYRDSAATGHEADWYGLSMALLAGDIQQAWSGELLAKTETHVGAATALGLLRRMMGWAVPKLIEGEAEDIVLAGLEFGKIDDERILGMMRNKTGVLYRFAGEAGARIALRATEPTEEVHLLGDLLGSIGLAFQLQDDLLGMTSSRVKLGKDPDSDIREGKRTFLAALAYGAADESGRKLMEAVLGDTGASPADVARIRDLFRKTGAVARVTELAEKLIRQGVAKLRKLPDRPQRRLLEKLALFAIRRDH